MTLHLAYGDVFVFSSDDEVPDAPAPEALCDDADRHYQPIAFLIEDATACASAGGMARPI